MKSRWKIRALIVAIGMALGLGVPAHIQIQTALLNDSYATQRAPWLRWTP